MFLSKKQKLDQEIRMATSTLSKLSAIPYSVAQTANQSFRREKINSEKPALKPKYDWQHQRHEYR